jgi:nitrous oxide reductase
MKETESVSRRKFIGTSAIAGAACILSVCGKRAEALAK